MESKLLKVRNHLDAVITYLTPLLPMANCHMVEFITNNHWDTFIPEPLRNVLEKCDLDEAVGKFWKAAECPTTIDNCPLTNWTSSSQVNHLVPNNEYCLSVEQFENKIRQWGGEIQHETEIKEFMSSKKSYEVARLSSLARGLAGAAGGRVSVEAGGGRGHLARALAAYMRCLTLDRDHALIHTAADRLRRIQKVCRVPKKVAGEENSHIDENVINENFHKFAQVYITTETDLQSIVKEKFPEFKDEDVGLLLTGLHTCGELGPASLRLLPRQRTTRALLNVPCCYHLLAERLQPGEEQGFPMSHQLEGFSLGRNARMLAAQSIHRVVHEKQLPAKSLFYRALLQVLIKNHKPDLPLADGKLKRISKRSSDFHQYFKSADSILKLNIYETLTQNYVENLEDSYNGHWKKLVMFYLLRLCLAQVVETVILLDRLLFLLELGYEDAYLVKLFDPVLSPRCHGIVCMKR